MHAIQTTVEWIRARGINGSEHTDPWAHTLHTHTHFSHASHMKLILLSPLTRARHAPATYLATQRADGGAPGGTLLGMKARLDEAFGRTVTQILAGQLSGSSSAWGQLLKGTEVTRLVLDRAAYPKLGEGSHTPRHYDLLKLDGDGPEGGWMNAIERLITRGLITVGAITLEGNNLYPSHMQVS